MGNTFYLAIKGDISTITYTEFAKILKSVLPVKNYNQIILINAGDKLIDAFSSIYAIDHQLPTLKLTPEWDKYGKDAPAHINKQLDDLIASKEHAAYLFFWDISLSSIQKDIENVSARKLQYKIYNIKEHIFV